MAADTNAKAHVVLFPSPGIGHLTPVVEFAKRLVLHHNLTATIITTSDLSCDVQQSLLSSLPTDISSVSLPPVPLDDRPANEYHIVTRLSLVMARSIPYLRQTLLSLKKTTRIASYIIDLFGGDTLSIATELGIPQYIFFTSNFFYLSFLLNLPVLYDQPYNNPDQMLSLPGCMPLHVKDFSPSATDRNNEVFAWMVRHAKHHDRVDGIMVNSFEALEGGAAMFLKERGNGKPPVIPIGPLTSNGGSEKSFGECGFFVQRWLDGQPVRSVLLIAFGSGGTLSVEQTRELALGLEMSEQRFLWVIQPPMDVDISATYFNSTRQGRNESFGFLPQGFLERTMGKGMVVPSWAPQAAILAHCATGGFLSHCGWNSTLESIVNGVPMIAWPLYSEQPMNAMMLVEGAKVALRPTCKNKDGVVRKEEIIEVVKDLMEGVEGNAVRLRIRELKEAAVKAVGVNGSSYEALAKIVSKWKISVLKN